MKKVLDAINLKGKKNTNMWDGTRIKAGYDKQRQLWYARIDRKYGYTTPFAWGRSLPILFSEIERIKLYETERGIKNWPYDHGKFTGKEVGYIPKDRKKSPLRPKWLLTHSPSRDSLV